MDEYDDLMDDQDDDFWYDRSGYGLYSEYHAQDYYRADVLE